MAWKAGVAVAATLTLMLGGCVERVADNVATVAVGVDFSVHVTGKAVVRWSDGVATHTVKVNKTGKKSWESTVDKDRFVAAMTVVPVGKGSKASCTISKSDVTGARDAYPSTDKTSGPGKAAVCIIAGQADEAQSARARTVTAIPTTAKGDARYRVATPNGAAFVDGLAGGQIEEPKFTVVGNINMVVVAQKADDVIGCRIASATADMDVKSAQGLGAIATCHALVTILAGR